MIKQYQAFRNTRRAANDYCLDTQVASALGDSLEQLGNGSVILRVRGVESDLLE